MSKQVVEVRSRREPGPGRCEVGEGRETREEGGQSVEVEGRAQDGNGGDPHEDLQKNTKTGVTARAFTITISRYLENTYEN